MRERTDEVREAVKYLTDSGLAEQIRKETKIFEIPYRRIPLGITKIKSRDMPVIRDSPGFYRFVVDYMRTIMSLCDDETRDGITMASKKIILDKNALYRFNRGWDAAQQAYKDSATSS